MEPNEVHPDVREVIAEPSENYIRGTCGHKVEIDRLRTALASRDAELAELRARCEELEMDKARLDFIFEHYGVEIVNGDYNLPRWLECREDVDAASTAAREG